MSQEHVKFAGVIADMFRKCKPEGTTAEVKLEALKDAQAEAKPLLDQLKEATRRIKNAGITPTPAKAGDTESTAEAEQK